MAGAEMMAGRAAANEKAVPRGGAREALLNAAAELMNERDTLDISLSDIAARAQVNSALVKYYFGSKSGMMVALLERALINPFAQLDHLVESSISAPEKLRIHIAGLINSYYRNRYLNKLLFSLLRDSTPEEALRISDRLVKPVAEAQRKVLEQGVKEGSLLPVDPMLFYFTIIGACDQIFTATFALRTVFGHPGMDDDLRRRFIDHTVTVLLSGLLTESRDDVRADERARA